MFKGKFYSILFISCLVLCATPKIAIASSIVSHNNVLDSGWVEDSNGWKYKYKGNFVVNDWVKDKEQQYYIDENGYMVTGFKQIGSSVYFFNPNGKLQKKNFVYDKKAYEVDDEGGIINIDSSEVDSLNASAKANGVKGISHNNFKGDIDAYNEKQEEKTTKEKTYYTNKQDIGWKDAVSVLGFPIKTYTTKEGKQLADCWLEDGGDTYYFASDGSMLSGMQEIDDLEYCFYDDGKLAKTGFNDKDFHYNINSTDHYVESYMDLETYKLTTNPLNPSTEKSSEYSGTNYYQGLTDAQKEAVNKKVEHFYKTYIEGKINKEDPDWKFKREVEIVKWLVANTEYDDKNYYANTIPNIDYTAYAILVNKMGVCSGFANAFALLAGKCEIPVIKVSGPNHAWNMVQLDDGEWYHVDSTWAVCTSHYKTHINLTDEQCKALPNGTSGINNHEYWSPNTVEAKGTKYGGDYLKEYLKTTYGINDRS